MPRPGLLAVLMLCLVVARAGAQEADWSQPLNAPFVDLFHVLPGARLLVGALGWNAVNAQFAPGALELISVSDGSVLWSTHRDPSPGALYSLIGLQQDTLILRSAASRETRLSGYNVQDGRLLWSLSSKGAVLASPMPQGGALIVAMDGEVSGLDIATGRRLWTRKVEARGKELLPTLVPTSDGVCIIARSVACVDRDTGAERWSTSDSDTAAIGRVLVLQGNLVVGSDTGVSAWRLSDGKLLWRAPSPVAGLAGMSAIDTALCVEWLDSVTLTARIQAVSLIDGQQRWLTEPVPIPNSGLVSDGNRIYFSSTALLVAVDLRSGKVSARAVLPAHLVDVDRRADDIHVRDSQILLVNEQGAAKFAAADLALKQLVLFQVGGKASEASRGLNETVKVVSKEMPSVRGTPTALHLGTGEALSNAAQTRIQLARAEVRPILESSSSSHSEKAQAHAYVAQQIQGAISMQRQAIQLEKLQATADLANAVLGVMQAFQEIKRRELQGQIALHRYNLEAATLREQGTPPGFAVAGNAWRLEVFDPSREAIGQFEHSRENGIGWVHIALITEDADHIIGAHVGKVPSQHVTSIYEGVRRPDLQIESYSLAKASWTKAARPDADPLVEGVRSGKITSLVTEYGACYAAPDSKLYGRLKDIVLAAMAGHNLPLLRDMRVHGAFLTESGFDPQRIARDLQDPELLGLLQDSTATEQAEDALMDAVLHDDRRKAQRALDAGASVDSRAAAGEVRTCTFPYISLAKSDSLRQFLLDHGAHVDLLDAQSHTPLDWAITTHNKSLERFLRSHGGHTAAELGH